VSCGVAPFAGTLGRNVYGASTEMQARRGVVEPLGMRHRNWFNHSGTGLAGKKVSPPFRRVSRNGLPQCPLNPRGQNKNMKS
jgi:hypothetical protein